MLISIGAMLISLVGLLLNSRKDTRTDAAATAIIQTKLDSLISGVDDIRVEMRSVQKEIRNQGERLAKVEARIDALEHKEGGL